MENEIVSEIRELGEAGLDRLKAKYGSLIRYIVSGILSDERDIEECIADVYVKVWQRIEDFDSTRGGFKMWLTAISRNSAVDRKRKTWRHDEPLDTDTASVLSPEEDVLKRERTETLRNVLTTLSESDRKIVYRKYYYLQPMSQIASEMGLTEKTVEGRLYRIRKKLRKQLGGELDG